jgi:N-acetylglucosamine kinase-like BadF-type ATPase
MPQRLENVFYVSDYGNMQIKIKKTKFFLLGGCQNMRSKKDKKRNRKLAKNPPKNQQLLGCVLGSFRNFSNQDIIRM